MESVKVLILHPADQIPPHRWDVVIDLGRAPRSTYHAWSDKTCGRVLSLYDWAREIEDLYRTKDLLQLGMGCMVDRAGIDWWDVCSLMVSPEMQQFILGRRVARELDPRCQLHATRDTAFVRGLQAVLGVTATIHRRQGPGLDRLRSALRSARTLDRGEMFQVLQDKLDGTHRVRHWFARRPRGNGNPLVLCPSAYINVSHTVASYATSHPEKEFFMVLARSNARISALPKNVRAASLDGYFDRPNSPEVRSLLHQWDQLRRHLMRNSEEFFMAESAGVLSRIPALVRWGIPIRDAWSRIFEIENIAECFCADDSNPYTRIPLILAKKRKLPTVACHHGALDCRLAFKTTHADVHLVKTEMERDYAISVCRLPSKKVSFETSEASLQIDDPCGKDSGCLTFFTEAYHSAGFREGELFRDLLPNLLAAAREMRLKLVLKLHPFDGRRKMNLCLSAALPRRDRKSIQVWSGPMSSERWRVTEIMVTGQSSVALEAVKKGIPAFLCKWLGDPFSGYQKQFVRYGIGKLLESVEEVLKIPRIVQAGNFAPQAKPALARFEKYPPQVVGAGA